MYNLYRDPGEKYPIPHKYKVIKMVSSSKPVLLSRKVSWFLYIFFLAPIYLLFSQTLFIYRILFATKIWL